ncbi:MAG: hypothetical protein MUF13_07740, partial [Akkermansiaceae bacterium]|nr:hypothetical protein [Akkermansiaceae bacterium]
QAPDFDFDNDGVANGLEFMTGSSPVDAGDANLPAVSINGSGDLVVSFERDDDAEAYDVFVETSTTLTGSWTEIAVPNAAVAGPPVDVVDNAAAPDDITVTIPAGVDPKKFARVKIVIPFTP